LDWFGWLLWLAEGVGRKAQGTRGEGYQRLESFERVLRKGNDTLRKRLRCESNESREAG
jgi:hypothetical protein